MYIIIFNPCKTTGYSTCVGDKSRSQRSRLRTWWRKTSALPGIVGDVRPFFGSLGIKPVPCLHTFPGIVEVFFLGYRGMERTCFSSQSGFKTQLSGFSCCQDVFCPANCRQDLFKQCHMGNWSHWPRRKKQHPTAMLGLTNNHWMIQSGLWYHFGIPAHEDLTLFIYVHEMLQESADL